MYSDRSTYLRASCMEFVESSPEVISNEGLGDFITSLQDSLTTMYANARTTITRMGKDFKRSELQTFYDNNKRQIDAYFKLPPSAFSPTDVAYVPEGFTYDFPKAIHHILECLHTLTRFHIKEINKALLSASKSVGGAVPTVNVPVHSLDASTSVVKSNLKSLMVTSSPSVVKITSIYKNKNDMYEDLKRFLQLDGFFKVISDTQGDLASTSDALRSYTSYIESLPDINKADLKEAIGVLLSVGNYLDMLSLALTTAMRYEHNVYLTLKKLVS